MYMKDNMVQKMDTIYGQDPVGKSIMRKIKLQLKLKIGNSAYAASAYGLWENPTTASQKATTIVKM